MCTNIYLNFLAGHVVLKELKMVSEVFAAVT